jgi:tetratricopeptide (TPR) repeat protein
VVVVVIGAGVAAGGPLDTGGNEKSLELPKGVEEIDKAMHAFDQRDYDGCLKLLQDAREKHPTLFPARLMMAKLFLLHGQAAAGRANLEQAAAEDANLPETYLLFGKLALADGRLTDAWLQFDKAATLARSGEWPDTLRRDFQVEAASGMATVAERRKDWPAAAAALAAWLKHSPENGSVRHRLGRVLFHAGKHDKALAELRHAAKDDATLDPAATTMAQLYAEEKEQSKAEEWFKKGIAQAPESAKAHLAFASWLIDQNRVEEAGPQADAAAKLDPRSDDIKGTQGLIAWQLKDYDRAEHIFEALHLRNPGNFSASNQLALALIEQSDDARHRRALQFAEINVRLYQNSPEALTTLGFIYYRQGQLEEAEKALRAAASKGTVTADGAYYLARVLGETGKITEAKKLLRLALDSSGRFAFRKEAQDWSDHLTKK